MKEPIDDDLAVLATNLFTIPAETSTSLNLVWIGVVAIVLLLTSIVVRLLPSRRPV